MNSLNPQSRNLGRPFEPQEIFRVNVHTENYPKSGLKNNQFEPEREMYYGYECTNHLVPETQICQNCQTTIFNYRPCPVCGYDVDKDIELRAKELELEELRRKGFESYLHAINVLAWTTQCGIF